MAPSSVPPEITIESEYCPQAVIEWFKLTGSDDRSAWKKDLALKAKKHLCFLGWAFWYVDKKGRWELRYTSPNNGKNYISLRRACESCIEDGGCGLENVHLVHETKGLVNGTPMNEHPSTSTATISSDEVNLIHETKGLLNGSPRIEQPSTSTISSENVNLILETKGLVKGIPRVEYPSTISSENVNLILETKGLVNVSPTVEHPSTSTSTAIISSENVQSIHENKGPVNGGTPKVENPLTIFSSAQKPPRKCKKTRVNEPRTCKKRKRVSSPDEEWTQVGNPEFEAGGKRGKVLRLSKRVRHGDDAQSSDSSVRNPRTIVSWLIDNNAVISESKVLCRGGKNVVKKGKLLRSGIVCDCCDEVFTLTRFEAHAGCTRHRPSSSIFLEDGRSLMECQREALEKMHHFTQGDNNYQDQNDSICSVCNYGGDLMLCDGCPSSFHHSCLGFDQVPDGEWFCPQCCCKICNRPRCSANDVDNAILICEQCEHKYHMGCLKTRGLTNVENKKWFCSMVCENIFFSLQKLIGKQIHVGFHVGGYNLTWTLLKAVRSDKHGGDLASDDDLEGLSQYDNKLSEALDLLHECFDPVIDGLSGRDIVSDVIFSRSSVFSRLNFRGFYTAILESNGEVLSVATLRIYGQKVAELPLVATKMGLRRIGMCRILMNELEKLLTKLEVENMILPSSPNVIDTWTNSFGFARMTDSDKFQFLDYTFLNFQDTIQCHKPLVKPAVTTYMA